MSTREAAHNVINRLDEEQLQAFMKLFGMPFDYAETEEPDEIDKRMIEESKNDNDFSMSLDEVAKVLGIDINEIRT